MAHRHVIGTISRTMPDEDHDTPLDASPDSVTGPRGLPRIVWNADETAGGRVPKLVAPPPEWHDWSPLPAADVVVFTWTTAEWEALHYVFLHDAVPLTEKPDDTTWQEAWLPYRRDFYRVVQPLWTHRLVQARRNRAEGAPALMREQLRWGSWVMVEVAGRKVLLFKSELHLNTDGETLPLVQLVRQVIEDSGPALVLSTGTSGGVDPAHHLGDVVVTSSARFHLGDELASARFNGETFASSWHPPTSLAARAEELMTPVRELAVTPPTGHFQTGTRMEPVTHLPRVVFSNLPILTTDFFEFGTTTNRLHEIGCCVEMDDAVVAMVCQELGVEFGFARNISDPVIIGELPPALQRAWAVVTYRRRGLFTSTNGALATWALVAA